MTRKEKIMFSPESRYLATCHECETVFCVPCDIRDKNENYQCLTVNKGMEKYFGEIESEC